MTDTPDKEWIERARVERVAIALWDDDRDRDEEGWTDTTERMRTVYRRMAKAVLVVLAPDVEIARQSSFNQGVEREREYAAMLCEFKAMNQPDSAFSEACLSCADFIRRALTPQPTEGERGA